MDLITPVMLAYEPQLLRSLLCGHLSGHRFGAPPGPGTREWRNLTQMVSEQKYSEWPNAPLFHYIRIEYVFTYVL